MTLLASKVYPKIAIWGQMFMLLKENEIFFYKKNGWKRFFFFCWNDDDKLDVMHIEKKYILDNIFNIVVIAPIFNFKILARSAATLISCVYKTLSECYDTEEWSIAALSMKFYF